MRVTPTDERAPVRERARTRPYPAGVISDDDWNAAAELVRERAARVRVAETDLAAALAARNSAVFAALPVIGAGWTLFARTVGWDPDGRFWCSPDLLRKIADQAPKED